MVFTGTISDVLTASFQSKETGLYGECPGDRAPAFEPGMMWEIEHIRLLPLRTRRVVFYPVIDAH